MSTSDHVFEETDYENSEEPVCCEPEAICSLSSSNVSEIDASPPPHPVLPMVSSPNLLHELMSPHLTDFFSSIEHGNVLEESSAFQPLYDGATIGVRNAVTTIDAFCNRFHLSDHASRTMMQVINEFLPEENLLPTPHSHVYQMKKNFIKETRYQ